MIPALSHVCAQLFVFQIGDDAMTHQSAHFVSEVDVFAYISRVFAKELVRYDGLFAW